MNTKLLALVTFGSLALAFAPANSQAAMGGGDQILIGISAVQLSTSTDGPNVGNDDEKKNLFDAKIGYAMANGFYFGGIYNSRTDELNSAKSERSGYGISIGYHNMGWFIDGAYYISSTYKLSGGTELKDGSGFGFDVGHNFDVLSNVYLGLQISYKSFTYNKAADVTVTNKVKSELAPMLNLGIMF